MTKNNSKLKQAFTHLFDSAPGKTTATDVKRHNSRVLKPFINEISERVWRLVIMGYFAFFYKIEFRGSEFKNNRLKSNWLVIFLLTKY